MSNQALREAIEQRHREIIEQLFYDSLLNENIEDFLEDLKTMSKAKKFKDICALSMRDYREEIKEIKEEYRAYSVYSSK